MSNIQQFENTTTAAPEIPTANPAKAPEKQNGLSTQCSPSKKGDLECRLLTELKRHPENVKLYGDTESIDDLRKSIPIIGLLEAIVITADGTIISGHRRYRALIKLERTEAIVRVIEPANETETLAALLEFNRHRIKTGSQLAHEATLHMRIE